jgi:hypothetical protein
MGEDAMMSFASERKPRNRQQTAWALALVVALSLSIVALVAASSAAAALNDVQVNIQTTQSLPFQYTLTAYNTSGSQVASFSGSYPEASFGLPSGTYLITASAYYQQNYCYPCPVGEGANGTVIPIRYQPPSSEYGYAVLNVNGPVQISIDTKNSSDLPVVSMPVHVSFHNGTAAAGAYVSAYLVGGGYSNSPNIVSSGQAGADGNFTLVMPEGPVQVSAYLSVPIQLPKNATTVVPVEVGGQKVNVTVYWQPSYVELSGQALILPPQSGADITLQVQQNQYPYPIYASSPGQGGVATVTTVTSTTESSGAGAASGQPTQISPFNPGGGLVLSGGPTTQTDVPYTALAVALVAALALTVTVGIVLARRKPTTAGARP